MLPGNSGLGNSDSEFKACCTTTGLQLNKFTFLKKVSLQLNEAVYVIPGNSGLGFYKVLARRTGLQ